MLWTDYVVGRLDQLRLKIASEKTEAVLLVSKGIPGMSIKVRSKTIETAAATKYLGAWLSRDSSFSCQISEAAAKGVWTSMTLSAIIPKSYGPSHKARQKIPKAATSAVLYSASLWANSLRNKCYRDLLRKETRSLLLRVCFGHGTMTTIAAEVIGEVESMHLQAYETD